MRIIYDRFVVRPSELMTKTLSQFASPVAGGKPGSMRQASRGFWVILHPKSLQPRPMMLGQCSFMDQLPKSTSQRITMRRATTHLQSNLSVPSLFLLQSKMMSRPMENADQPGPMCPLLAKGIVASSPCDTYFKFCLKPVDRLKLAQLKTACSCPFKQR